MLWVWARFNSSAGNFCSNSGMYCLNTLRVRVGKRWNWFLFPISISWSHCRISGLLLKMMANSCFQIWTQNLRHWILNIYLIFNIFSSLNIGSVWALNFLFVIIRMARFWSLKTHSNQIPNMLSQIVDWTVSKSHTSASLQPYVGIF